MTAWFDISLQDGFWVPQAGWDTWVTTRDLSALADHERLEISLMAPAHRLRAATLFVDRFCSALLDLDAPRTAQYHALASQLVASPPDPLALCTRSHQTALTPYLLAVHTPLCRALLDQPPLVHPLIDATLRDELCKDLPARLDTSELTAMLDSGNDALVTLASRRCAQLSRPLSVTLLGKLLLDGVLLHDALFLDRALAR